MCFIFHLRTLFSFIYFIVCLLKHLPFINYFGLPLCASYSFMLFQSINLFSSISLILFTSFLFLYVSISPSFSLIAIRNLLWCPLPSILFLSFHSILLIYIPLFLLFSSPLLFSLNSLVDIHNFLWSPLPSILFTSFHSILLIYFPLFILFPSLLLLSLYSRKHFPISSPSINFSSVLLIHLLHSRPSKAGRHSCMRWKK